MLPFLRSPADSSPGDDCHERVNGATAGNEEGTGSMTATRGLVSCYVGYCCCVVHTP
jgi:hypothetical protein